MQEINWDVVTKPTPEPYDAADPTRQQENFYFMLNQVLGQLSGTQNIDLAEEIGGLAVAGSTVEIPGFIRVSRHGRTLSLTLTP